MAPKISFNPKHHEKGDPKPPYNGKLRLYSMRYCPFAQRAALTLLAKQIDFEIINVKIFKPKPEWLNEMNPFGTVPVIEAKEGQYVYESLVTVDYLEELFPEKPTMAKDPFRRALDRIIVEANSTVVSYFYKALRSPESVTESVLNDYHKVLSFFEEQLQSRRTKFLGGNEPGYPDFMIWPWFERMYVLKDVHDKLRIDPKFKILTRYIDDMLKNPIISEYFVPEHAMKEFYKGYLTYDLDYSILPEGDPDPPKSGKIRLYNMRFCPFSQRVIYTLLAKNIDFEVFNIDQSNPPEWITKKTATGMTPILEIGEARVFESLPIVDYLEDVFPEKSLFPKDPLLKAYDRIIVELQKEIQNIYYQTIKKPETVNDELVKRYHGKLSIIQDEIIRRGGKFLGGDQPGYADYMIWPWFERIMPFVDIYPTLKIEAPKFKLLADYIQKMYKDPLISQYAVPPHIMGEFYKGYAVRKPNYDLLYSL